MSAQTIKAIIHEAFKGVALEDGVSMKQGQICDNYGKDQQGREISRAEYERLPESEITHDWRLLTLDYLEEYPFLAYSDAKSFRYYIPAFMLGIFESYDPIFSHSVAALHSLYPRRDGQWNYYMMRYALLDEKQRRAIALYLRELPSSVKLYPDDVKLTQLALKNFWDQYLPTESPGG